MIVLDNPAIELAQPAPMLAVETKTYLNSLEGRNPQTFHITNHFNERWLLEIMRDAYTKFGLKQGKFLDEYQKKEEGDNFDENWLLLLLLLFKDISYFYIVLGIINTIKQDIKRFVEDQLDRGVPKAAIITLLGLYLSTRNIIRSQTIARTEITKIMNLASKDFIPINGVSGFAPQRTEENSYNLTS